MDERTWFEQVYRQHVDLLYRIGRRLQSPSIDEDALDEILQEVFLTLWDRRDALMNHPNIGGWLTQALKFRVSGRQSKLSRRALHHAYSLDEDDAPPVADGSDSPETLAALSGHYDALRDLLGEEDARLFLAHVLGGKTVRELSAEYGISESGVSMRLFRLRKKLRAHPEIFYAVLLWAWHFRRLTI